MRVPSARRPVRVTCPSGHTLEWAPMQTSKRHWTRASVLALAVLALALLLIFLADRWRASRAGPSLGIASVEHAG